MGMVAILVNGVWPLNKLSIPLQQKDPHELWWKLAQRFQKLFKDFVNL